MIVLSLISAIAITASSWSLGKSSDAFEDNTSPQLTAESDDGVIIFFCESGKISLSIASYKAFGRYPILRSGRYRIDKQPPQKLFYTVGSIRAAMSDSGRAAQEMLAAKQQIGIEIMDSQDLPVRMTFSMIGGAKQRSEFLKTCRK